MEARVLQLEDRGTGDPLVLIPGGLTGWVSWLPHHERLLDRHRVVQVQPIHNELGSAGGPSYDTEVERESLRLTLGALDLEQPPSCRLVGGWAGA